jgi:hypothetical protein
MIYNITMNKKMTKKVKKEVDDSRQEDLEWQEFSLSGASRGIEDDDIKEYAEPGAKFKVIVSLPDETAADSDIESASVIDQSDEFLSEEEVNDYMKPDEEQRKKCQAGNYQFRTRLRD